MQPGSKSGNKTNKFPRILRSVLYPGGILARNSLLPTFSSNFPNRQTISPIRFISYLDSRNYFYFINLQLIFLNYWKIQSRSFWNGVESGRGTQHQLAQLRDRGIDRDERYVAICSNVVKDYGFLFKYCCKMGRYCDFDTYLYFLLFNNLFLLKLTLSLSHSIFIYLTNPQVRTSRP